MTNPTPQRRAAGPLPALVPSPPTPTRATHRTRDPLPGDHRDRTATSGRPQKAQPQTATKNTAHLVPNAQLRAAGQCEQVQIHGGDVLAQLARLESLQANLRRRGRTEAGPPAMALPST